MHEQEPDPAFRRAVSTETEGRLGQWAIAGATRCLGPAGRAATAFLRRAAPRPPGRAAQRQQTRAGMEAAPQVRVAERARIARSRAPLRDRNRAGDEPAARWPAKAAPRRPTSLAPAAAPGQRPGRAPVRAGGGHDFFAANPEIEAPTSIIGFMKELGSGIQTDTIELAQSMKSLFYQVTYGFTVDDEADELPASPALPTAVQCGLAGESQERRQVNTETALSMRMPSRWGDRPKRAGGRRRSLGAVRLQVTPEKSENPEKAEKAEKAEAAPPAPAPPAAAAAAAAVPSLREDPPAQTPPKAGRPAARRGRRRLAQKARRGAARRRAGRRAGPRPRAGRERAGSVAGTCPWAA